jgi:PAS domain S-box-containing protein
MDTNSVGGNDKNFKSQQQLNDVLETLPCYLILITPDHYVPFANKFFRERFGESHGKRCYEYLFSRTEPCENCQTFEVLKTMRPHEWDWVGPDGCDYHIYDFPFESADGSALIMEVGIDVTLQKKALSELRNAHNDLENRVEERTRELKELNRLLRAKMVEHKQAEQRFRQVSEEWQATFDSINDMVSIQDADFKLVRVNQAYAKTVGVAREELVGRYCYDAVHHSACALTDCPHLETLKTRKSATREIFEPKLGLYLQITTSPILNEAGELTGSVHVAKDITERKRAEENLIRLNRELRAITDCNQAIVRAEDERALYKDVCRIMCEVVGYRMAWIGAVEHNKAKSVRPVAFNGENSGYLAKAYITWADTEMGRGPTGVAARTGKPDFCQDFTAESKIAPWQAAALERGFRSSIALPLKDSAGNVFAVFSLYDDEPDRFTPAEVIMLEELTGDIAFGVEVLRERIRRREAEENLRETRDYLDNLFNYANAPIIVWDKNFRITRFNHAFEHLTGYTIADVLGGKLDILFPVDSRKESLKHIYQAASGERWETVEIPIIHKDGTVRILLWNSANLYDQDGKTVVATIAQGQDITERKKSEEALRESRRKLEAAMGSMQEAIFIADAEGRFTDYNDEFVRYHRFGDREECSREIAECSKYIEAFFEDGARAPLEMWAMPRALRGETGSNVEYKLRRKETGETWWGSYNFGSIKDKDGKIVGAVVAAREITGLKKAEEDYRRQQAEIQTLFENIPAGLVLFDANPPYRVMVHNKYYQELFAEPFRSRGMVGLNIYNYAPAVEASGVVAVFEEVIQTGKAKSFLDFPYNADPPKESWFNWYMAPIIVDDRVVALVSMSVDVTERHMVEQALKESEERFRAIAETSLVCISVTRVSDYTILFANQAFCDTFGYPWESVIGKKLDLYANEADKIAFRQTVNNQGHVQDKEVRVKKADGTLFWVSSSVQTINYAGEPAFLGALVDITERKKAEAEIAHLASFPLLNPNPIVELDTAANVLYANPSALRCFPGIVSLGNRHLFVSGLLDKISQGAISYSDDINIGDYWYERSLTFAENSNSYRIYGRDITARKQAEDALMESEDQFRRAIEDAPVPVIMLTEDGQTLQISRSWTELTGYTARDMPTFEDWLKRACGEGAGAVQQEMQSLFSGNQRIVSIEFPVKTAGGQLCYWNFSASSPGALRDGRRFVVGMAVDITERKRVEQMKDEFIGLVSHELRTPLTVISGSLNTAMSPGLAQEEVFELIENAIGGADQLGSILENMLELSRYQAGHLKLRQEPVSVPVTTRNVVNKLKAQGVTQEFSIDILPDIHPVEADPVRLERIIYNLAENATKYSPEGSLIEISAREDGDFVVVTVSDQGQGISPEDQPRLFEQFQQLETGGRRRGGAGLGLVVCKRLVEAQGGWIKVESEIGKGSRFSFGLLRSKETA